MGVLLSPYMGILLRHCNNAHGTVCNVAINIRELISRPMMFTYFFIFSVVIFHTVMAPLWRQKWKCLLNTPTFTQRHGFP